MEIAGDVPGIAHHLLVIDKNRNQRLSAETQFLLVAVPTQLDRDIESLVGQRHADAPAIWAVSLAVLVNEIVQRDGHGRLHSAQKCTFYDTAMNLDLQFAAGYLDARPDLGHIVAHVKMAVTAP